MLVSWGDSPEPYSVNVLTRSVRVQLRETREGWPLLTVETEVNGDSKSTNERGPSKGTPTKCPSSKGPATKGPATKGPGYERSGCKRSGRKGPDGKGPDTFFCQIQQ